MVLVDEYCSGVVERMPIADEIVAVLNEIVCRELMPALFHVGRLIDS